MKARPQPVFSCRCSQVCEMGVSWFSRAPMADCFEDDKACRCPCHAKAAEFAAVNLKYKGEGMRLLTAASDHAKFSRAEAEPRSND